MSSFSSPARSGPNSTPTRLPSAPIARAIAIARSGVTTSFTSSRPRAVVAKTKSQSATAPPSSANSPA